MRNLNKLSAIVLSTLFATMQVSLANIDTGLGAGNGGASIINAGAGYAGISGQGTGNVDLKFNGNSHVQWNTLNINKNETLNFNAVENAKNLTILNTVNNNMSKIYGNINTNSGISKLIISNPNGVLFDGAKFTTAGDVMITNQNATLAPNGAVTYTESNTAYTPNGQNYVINIQNSDFTTGGEMNFVAPTMNVVKSAFHTKNGTGNVRFTTTNGQDYFVTSSTSCNSCTDKYTETQSMRLEAINVDGNVYIVNDKGIVKTVNGGSIKGDLNIQSDGSVAMNYVNNGNKLNVTGDINAKANGPMMYLREANVDGNVNMTNGGGFLEVNNAKIDKNMNLTTTAESENKLGYKHFVHVIGNTDVKGDATINSKNNIHIGNYNFEEKKLLDGNFKVGGDLTAHADNGHVMTTIDVQANKIDYTSDKLNVLSSKDALLTANEYRFKSNGYIGAIKDGTKNSGAPYTATEQIIDIMENYTYIPNDIASHEYMHIAGGNITKIETPHTSNTYILSNGDLLLNGADAGDIYLIAPDKKIKITGDVTANNINIGGRTGTLELDFPSRKFTTHYTNIKDETVVTIAPDEEITYELTNKEDVGYNSPDYQQTDGTNTTYLVGPEKPDDPTPDDPTPDDPTPDDPTPDDPTPDDPTPDDPTPDDPTPDNPNPDDPNPDNPNPDNPNPDNPNPDNPNPDNPNPTPEKPKKPQNDDNVKVMRNWAPNDITAPQASTPVAFAADLDEDDITGPARKNVDGSVTVVRAVPVHQ